MKKVIFVLSHFFLIGNLYAEDGYRLWLRYDKIDNPRVLQQYRASLSSVQMLGNNPTIIAAKTELIQGLEGLLGSKIAEKNNE